MLGILVAAISGAIMSVQGVFNAEVTKQTSIWLSSAFVQISALWSVYWLGLLPEEMVQSAVCGMFRLNICC